MAESDPIQRMKAAARRASGPVTVETQRSWYFDELDRDLGRDPSGTRGWQLETPSRARRAFRYLLKMIALAATVFALTSAAMLWRSGAFDGLLPEAPPAPPTEKRWTIIAEPPPPERGSQIKEGQDAPPSLVEPPAPPPAARAPQQDADEPADDGE